MKRTLLLAALLVLSTLAVATAEATTVTCDVRVNGLDPAARCTQDASPRASCVGVAYAGTDPCTDW